jgi:hypothetical protein
MEITLMNWLVSFIGLFYCVAAVIALRAILQGIVIDSALIALSANNSPSKQATPQWGNIWLLDGSFLVGLAGVSAVIQWEWAPWFFALAAFWQAVYLAYIAPKWVDGPGPMDEDTKKGRQQTRNAFIVFLLATIFVAYVYELGLLTTTSNLEWLQWTVAVTAIAFGFIYYGYQAWQLKSLLLGQPLGSPNDGENIHQREIIFPNKIQVRINQSLGFFFNQETGEPIQDAFELFDLPISVEDLFDDWMVHWVNHMDPTDPQRLRLLDPADWPIIQACAQRAFDALIAHIQQQEQQNPTTYPLKTTQFELLAEGVAAAPTVHPQVLTLKASFDCWPLYGDLAEPSDGNEPANISPDELGLSWGLSRHIEEWSSTYEESSDNNFPNPKSTLSDSEILNMNEAGLALVERIRLEFKATDRSHIRVIYSPIE